MSPGPDQEAKISAVDLLVPIDIRTWSVFAIGIPSARKNADVGAIDDAVRVEIARAGANALDGADVGTRAFTALTFRTQRREVEERGICDQPIDFFSEAAGLADLEKP